MFHYSGVSTFHCIFHEKLIHESAYIIPPTVMKDGKMLSILYQSLLLEYSSSVAVLYHLHLE